MVNVVYYDEVIWDAKFRWNNETKELKEEKVEKLFPVASLTKVITVSTKLSIKFNSVNQIINWSISQSIKSSIISQLIINNHNREVKNCSNDYNKLRADLCFREGKKLRDHLHYLQFIICSINLQKQHYFKFAVKMDDFFGKCKD